MFMVVGLLILLFVVFFSVFLFATGKLVSKERYYKVTFFFIAGMAVLAFHFHPTRTGIIEEEYTIATWDITRYYIEIQSISRYSFSQILKMAATISEPLRFLLWYLLSFLPSLEYFQSLSVVIACSLLFYCTIKSKEMNILENMTSDKNRYDYSIVLLSVMSLFSMIDFFEMMNTGRNIVACMILIFGIMQIYQKNRKIMGYILIGVAGLLHISMWGVLLMVLLNGFFIRFEKLKFVLLFWRIIPQIITGVLQTLPFYAFSVLANKISADTLAGDMSLNRIIYGGMFTVFSACAYYYLAKKKKNIDKRGLYFKILNFLQMLLLVMLGGLETNISFRLGYIVAIMSPFYLFDNDAVKKLKNDNVWAVNAATLIYTLCCCGLLIYDFFKALTIIRVAGSYFG